MEEQETDLSWIKPMLNTVHLLGLQEGEHWVGNTNRGIWDHLKHLKTVRLGGQAYDIYGEPLPEPYHPLIVGKDDYNAYNRIMDALTKEG